MPHNWQMERYLILRISWGLLSLQNEIPTKSVTLHTYFWISPQWIEKYSSQEIEVFYRKYGSLGYKHMAAILYDPIFKRYLPHPIQLSPLLIIRWFLIIIIINDALVIWNLIYLCQILNYDRLKYKHFKTQFFSEDRLLEDYCLKKPYILFSVWPILFSVWPILFLLGYTTHECHKLAKFWY